MTKAISQPPYRSAMSVNHRILRLSSDIAFRMGRLSCLGTVEGSAPLCAEEVKFTLASEGIKLTASQMRALNAGEEIPSSPLASALLRLYSRLGKANPYSPEILSRFEKEVYPDGVPMRKSSKIEGADYPLPPYNKVRKLLENLFDFEAKNKEIMSPVTLACLLYFEVLALAPYSEQNGILARFWFKAMLGEAGRSMEALRIGKSLFYQKEKLDEAFALAGEKQDSAPFVECLLEIILSSVNALLREASQLEAVPSPSVDRLLSKMARGRFYSAQELCALLGLKSRLGLQKNYLRPALDRGKILMSNPLCPTDRNQRYCKKEGIL
ncbi:MAG: hypothetical protein SPI62_04415 [Candidatus Enteromonas sp.]|nr:Fic family protein [bacterium]MDD6917992.1 Fic family protein [bacterium]MDY6101092.1 hypothetical protein [Candidatus Enteromonas sp.]